jgi:osmotically-inducible protein OsmY
MWTIGKRGTKEELPLSVESAGVMPMDDSKLRQDVLDELNWHPHISSEQINVTADRGVVRLSGYVATYAEKVAAEQAVKHVAGVRVAVLESLEVRVADEIADADVEISTRARTSISWAALVPNGQVEVSVERRWVTLSGELEWHFQRAAAETVVRNLAGVAGVTNKITLRPLPQTTNLKSHIERALTRSAGVDARFIRVKVVDGLVTLEGAVGSWYARERAEEAAWMAPGVRAVHDTLVVM